MAVDVAEVVEVEEAAPSESAAQATAGLPGGDDALSMMRDGLKATTPVEDGGEAEPVAAEADPVAGDEPKPEDAAKPAGSRRAKTVEKVKTEAEQKIADAEARAAEALARAEAAEQKIQQQEASQTDEAKAAADAKLVAEFGSWVGTPEQYAEAQRWSRMDNTSPDWDWDRHQQEVAKLNAFDERRTWAGRITEQGKTAGRAEALGSISTDFLETLSADLPEDKRDAYKTHKDGIPGAVRFYAETVYAPKIEELESTIAEKDAEIERLRTRGGRAPEAGSAAPGSPAVLDYRTMSPEELMTAELREMERRRGRRA